MQGLMQDGPLMTLRAVLRRAERLWPTKRLVAAGRYGRARIAYARPAGALRRPARALTGGGPYPGVPCVASSPSSAAPLPGRPSGRRLP